MFFRVDTSCLQPSFNTTRIASLGLVIRIPTQLIAQGPCAMNIVNTISPIGRLQVIPCREIFADNYCVITLATVAMIASAKVSEPRTAWPLGHQLVATESMRLNRGVRAFATWALQWHFQGAVREAK
jgi:hypothetical protein